MGLAPGMTALQGSGLAGVTAAVSVAVNGATVMVKPALLLVVA